VPAKGRFKLICQTDYFGVQLKWTFIQSSAKIVYILQLPTNLVQQNMLNDVSRKQNMQEITSGINANISFTDIILYLSSASIKFDDSQINIPSATCSRV
jgi:hypothetical protein